MSDGHVYATRKFTFSAAHRYGRPEWSESENRRVFGHLTVSHGHNYVLEVTIRGPVDEETGMVMDLAGKSLSVKHVPGPEGVRGRNSHNELIDKMLGWKPSQPLKQGLEATYSWIEAQVRRAKGRNAKAAQ